MQLSVKNLSYSYDQVLVLQDINLNISTHEVVLIKGINGSGKTTLLKCMAGILNSGKNIYIDNIELKNKKELFRRISYIMSGDTLYDYLTVRENIKLFSELFQENTEFYDKVVELMTIMKLNGYQDYLVKHLSSGTRHKVYLSVMLSKKSDILILDEPFSSIDKESQELMTEYIASLKKNKLIIFVTHIKEFEKLATRTIELNKIKE